MTIGEFFIGLLSDVAASLVMKLRIRKLFPNDYTRFWDPFFRSDLVIITPAEEIEPQIKSQVLDFQGLEVLKGIFQQYYRGRYKQTNCQDVSRNLLVENLLLVAGPIPNLLTRHILKPDKASVRYYFDDHVLRDKENPNLNLAEELDEDSMHPTTDYGIISSLKNPFNLKSRVIISSGVYGWGTYAGLVALSNKEILKYLTEHADDKEFQILVKIGVYRRVPEDPVLLRDTLHIVKQA